MNRADSYSVGKAGAKSVVQAVVKSEGQSPKSTKSNPEAKSESNQSSESGRSRQHYG